MDSENWPSTKLALGTALICLTLYYILPSHRKKLLPPGPRRWPIVGNALSMPTTSPWLTFAEWRKRYGNMVYLTVFGQPIIVIGSAKIANDLLDKKAAIYSDRPKFIMSKLVGYDEVFVLQSHNENWRKQRRLVAHDFSQAVIPKYHPFQEKETAMLVRNLLANPDSLLSEIQLRIGAVIIGVTYGYQVRSADDPILTTPLQAMINFSKVTTPGTFLVDLVPALRHLPKWMPGSGFLHTVDGWKKIFMDASWAPYKFSKRNLDTGKALMPNVCATVIQEKGENMTQDDEEKLVYAASSVLGGGLDTNMSSVLTFLMAMILNPRIQAKAQAELDSVVGKERLPLISDRPNLPYLRSIMAEVFRWSPAFPLGIPHALREDDVYEGLFLPKGSWIIPNVWDMLHDPEQYSSPMEFHPERFNGLDSEMMKVNDLVFGFGRRVCPGMHFAEGTFFSIIATTLATCDVLPGLDDNGNEVMPKYAYTPGTISFPEPFPVRFRARSPEGADLLAEVSVRGE